MKNEQKNAQDPVPENPRMPLTRRNYILLAVGFAVILLGFVLMAGGGAMLGGLRKLVERTLQVKCVVAKDAVHCVAKGTAIAFRNMDTLLDGFENIAVYQF